MRPTKERIEEIRNCYHDEDDSHLWYSHGMELLFEIDALREENATLRHEFKMAQASMPEVKKLRERIERLRECLNWYGQQITSIPEVTAPGWTARSALAADDVLAKQRKVSNE